MITRKQYINKEATHREYYGQFVDESLIEAVVSRFNLMTLYSDRGESFNNVTRLMQWDQFGMTIATDQKRMDMLGEANGSGGWSLSDLVCIGKEAAQQACDLVDKGEL